MWLKCFFLREEKEEEKLITLIDERCSIESFEEEKKSHITPNNIKIRVTYVPCSG